MTGSGLKTSFKPVRVRPLVWTAAAWAAGAACAVPLYDKSLLIWVIPCIICAVCTLLRRRLLALIGAVFFLAAAVTGAAAVKPVAHTFDEKVTVTGMAASDMRDYEDYSMITLSHVAIDGEARAFKLRLYIYPDADGNRLSLVYGDTVSFRGMPRSPTGLTGFGGYDRASALWRTGIAMTVYSDADAIEYETGRLSPRRLACIARMALSKRIDSLYGDSAPIARALLLGDKTALSDGEYSAFRGAGIVHLLAVSGLHVSVLALFIKNLLGKIFRLSRKCTFFILMPLLLLYAALTGFPASILRAAICFAIAEGAPLTGRPYDRLSSLALAYLLIVLVRPLFTFDTGLILSFSAMAGICFFMPLFERPFKALARQKSLPVRLFGKACSLAAMSAAASLGTLPAVSCLYGGLTLWSLIVNIAAIPLTSAIMPLLAISAAAGTGGPVTFSAAKLIGLLRGISSFISGLGTGLNVSLAFMLTPFAIAYIAVSFASSSYLKVIRSSKLRFRLKGMGILLLIAIAAANTFAVKYPVLTEQGLRITFYDVGQGDSALVNAQGNLYLIDTGRSYTSSRRLAAGAIKLNGLFLTHPDDDHIGDMTSVIQSADPETVYLPFCWEEAQCPDYAAEALKGRNIIYLHAGDELKLSDTTVMHVLHPGDGKLSSDNDASLVLLLSNGKRSVLFMGDLSDNCIDFPVPDCDIIKLAHHGSGSSSGMYMLLSASPSAAVISVGQNRYGHPAPAVLENLAFLGTRALRTDELGDISVLLSDDGSMDYSFYLED